ncbi:MAG: sigma factor-like helix-turn-helix DNA-binding protein [Gammaproteobacteria bacterium]
MFLANTDAFPGLPDLLKSVQNGTAVEAALLELSEAHCQAITLAFLEECSHQEIAERLQSPVGTVKSNIRRGVLKLRQLLDVAHE